MDKEPALLLGGIKEGNFFVADGNLYLVTEQVYQGDENTHSLVFSFESKTIVVVSHTRNVEVVDAEIIWKYRKK